jgi:hypothetical protein
MYVLSFYERPAEQIHFLASAISLGARADCISHCDCGKWGCDYFARDGDKTAGIEALASKKRSRGKYVSIFYQYG